MSKGLILFVDDDSDVLFAGSLLLRQAGYEVHGKESPDALLEAVRKKDPDLVLLDMNFKGRVNSGNEGLFWLRELQKKNPDLPVVMITAFGEIEMAVNCIKEGASDFISKPWDNDKLLQTVKAAIRKVKPKKASGVSHDSKDGMMGESPALLDIKKQVEKIAPTDASVLILGANGTGKEVLARSIHNHSRRNKGPFISVDLGAIPDTLFESELFGHHKGAFTDAHEDRQGKFEQAQGGTLFLDEIGNLSATNQAKLLTAVQNQQIQKLGGKEITQVDIRIIAATNAPLPELVKSGKFRQDLLYRLNTLSITLPDLKDRGSDIQLLANAFLDRFKNKYQRQLNGFCEGAIDKLNRYHWPGNIRELQHVIERAVILTESDCLEAHDILLEELDSEPPASERGSAQKLEDVERSSIAEALERNQHNLSAAARELGLSRAALYRRMDKYGL